MAALHTLFAIFFAFGFVQLGNTYGTEEPFTRSQEGVQCYDKDFDIIQCDWGCESTQDKWEGGLLEAKPSGCMAAGNSHLGHLGQCGNNPLDVVCFCNEPLCNNSMKNKSWWITLALAFCLFKLFV